jgi:F0F1-type ATP synthase beta subunit
VENYFTQPFFCAEPCSNRSGVAVSVAEAVRTCAEILDGRHDDVPIEAFYFSGGMTSKTIRNDRSWNYCSYHACNLTYGLKASHGGQCAA